MIKIKVCTQYPEGACSYYRSLGVISKLSYLKTENIIVEKITEFEWSNLINTDIVFFERPRSADMVKAMEFVKQFGIKIWSDIDDDFFSVPIYNPSHKFFSQPNTINAITRCLELTDVLTVTTPALQKKYKKYCANKPIIIIENAFNDYNFQLSEQPSDNNIINWRGSNTHRNDLLSCIKQLTRLSEEKTDCTFNFIGNDLWYIAGEIKNFNQIEEKTNVSYFNYIKKLQPQIQIFPLEFNEFNLAKSNISWIEGTYSGAVNVCADMPEWNKPGIETYKTPEEFYEKVILLLTDKKKRIKNFYESLDYIKENLLLSIVNKKRLEVMANLLQR
jgi:hypothetical protein